MKRQAYKRAINLLSSCGPGSDRSRVVGLVLAWLLGLGSLATAQGLDAPLGSDSRPALGGTGAMRPPAQTPLFSGSQNANVKMHIGPTGKPCLSVQGYAKPQAMSPNIFN